MSRLLSLYMYVYGGLQGGCCLLLRSYMSLYGGLQGACCQGYLDHTCLYIVISKGLVVKVTEIIHVFTL